MSLLPSLQIFRHRGYRYYWFARQMIGAERQMVAVAIGWQIYDLARLTRSIEESALLLGFVGLAQFTPVLLFSLIGGQAADRVDRKTILIVANLVRAGVIGALLAASFAPPDIAIPAIFAAAAMMGVVNAFTPAATAALYPRLVPRDELPLAIAWNSIGIQTAFIVGPALGGFLYIAGAPVVYAVAGIVSLAAVGLFALMPAPAHERDPNARSWRLIIEGLRYIRDNRIVLGAISLDLVVCFFGGVTALLPVFAKDILHVGAEGLGLMRAAPAAGAVIVAFLLARRSLTRRVGAWLIGAVAVYGVGILAFGASRALWLSLIALAVMGGADMISIYVRQALIQLATPDRMRGRVSSVSYIFIAASNELGEFESGVAARFLGPAGAVFLGGAVAIAAAALWFLPFPQLVRADRFEDAGADQSDFPAKAAS